MNGVLVVDKPVGPTSHDVVALARRALATRRVGHTGTLDPQASGVLPLVVGSATRLAQYLTAGDKEYEATVRFGATTDTADLAGTVVAQTGRWPGAEALEAALTRFRGTFDQVPPAFSAKKIGGERAYALARQARPVRLTAVPVRVDALELLQYEPPDARLRVRASAGFYVRSLAADLGEAVGTGACLAALRRTAAGPFALRQAVPLAALAPGATAELGDRLVPLEALLPDWPAVHLTSDAATRARHGRDLGPGELGGPAPGRPVRLLGPDGRLLGLAEPVPGGFLHPSVVLG
ncbi:MAG: tRNA pseudouridine(55) synthase TruB [Acidobacteriota bacterium]